MKTPDCNILSVAREVMRHEADCIFQASSRLADSFLSASKAIYNCNGRIVVMGVGKSGLIGRKIASTLASTGTPAFFVHAAEAGHGDLGMLTKDDVAVLISNSGESEEICNIAPLIKRFGATLIGLTGNEKSTLGRSCDIVVDVSVPRESCPLNLAPTASTAVQLAVGDALAVVVLKMRGFSSTDFLRTHPRGALGRGLYLRVADIMTPISEQQLVAPHALIVSDVINAMRFGRGSAIVVNDPRTCRKIVGIFTDSDLRRMVSRADFTYSEFQELTVDRFMTPEPVTINVSSFASDALRTLESKKVSRLPVLDREDVCGTITSHDLFVNKLL